MNEELKPVSVSPVLSEESKIEIHHTGIQAEVVVPDVKPTLNAAIEETQTTIVAPEYCGKCKREKVDGKCQRCGRPPEYKPEYVGAVDVYLKDHQDTPRGDSEDKLNVKLPTLEGFASFIGVVKPTILDWEKIYPEFSYALDQIRREQQERLLNKGLSGQYNPVIAKLILSSNHGMRERVDSDLTTKGEQIKVSALFDALKK